MGEAGGDAGVRGGDAGVRGGGGGVLRAQRARKTKAGGGGKGPRPPALWARSAQPPPPLGRWGFLPSFRTKRPFFRTNFLQTKQARRSR